MWEYARKYDKSRGERYPAHLSGERHQIWSRPAHGTAGERLELLATLMTSGTHMFACPVRSQDPSDPLRQHAEPASYRVTLASTRFTRSGGNAEIIFR